MAYTVLIADDEYWTRKKLCHMIPWEDYSLRLLKPAENGEEVLERLKKEHVDILITDINMPFVNGVELLERIRTGYPEVVSFVVSGYDDFAYVRDSFMYGSVHYLIKPVTKIDLVNALAQAMEIISRKEKERTQLLRASSLIQDREFSQLIQKENTSCVPNMSLNSRMGLASFSMMLIKIHNLHAVLGESQNDINLLSYRLKKEIRSLIRTEEAIVFNHIFRSNEFIVISEMSEDDLVRTAEKIRIYFRIFPNVCLTFCISGRSYPLASIHMAYVDAISLLMTRKFCKKDEIISANGVRRDLSSQRFRSHFGEEQEKHLRQCLQSGKYRVLPGIIFVESGLSGCEAESWTYMEVRQTVRQILNILSEFVLEKYGSDRAASLDSLIEMADKTVESLDTEAVCAALREMIDCLEPVTEAEGTETMQEIVRQARAYIDKYYYEDLTLSSLAEKFHVESSYFSRIFRQETGQTLTVYITEKKMEKAKGYIRKGKASLTEVAALVGYDDYTYFSRVFRKNTGLSPREYRNSKKCN